MEIASDDQPPILGDLAKMFALDSGNAGPVANVISVERVVL